MNILCNGKEEIKDNFIEDFNKLKENNKNQTTYLGNFSKIQKLKENYRNKKIKLNDSNEENISQNILKEKKTKIYNEDFTENNNDSSVLEIIEYPKDEHSFVSEKHSKFQSNDTAQNRETHLMKIYINKKSLNNINNNEAKNKYLKKLNKINVLNENNTKTIINKNELFTGTNSNISENTIIINSTIHFTNSSKNFEKTKDSFNKIIKQNNSKNGGIKKELFMKCIPSKKNVSIKNSKKYVKKYSNYSINVNSDNTSICPKKTCKKVNIKNYCSKDKEIITEINNKLKDVAICNINNNKNKLKINRSLNVKNNLNKNKLISCLTNRNILLKNYNAYNHILNNSQKNIKNVKKQSQILKRIKPSSTNNLNLVKINSKNNHRNYMKQSSCIPNMNINQRKIIIYNNNKKENCKDISFDNLSLGLGDKLNVANKAKKKQNNVNFKNEYLDSKKNVNTINDNKSPKKNKSSNKIINENTKNSNYSPKIDDKIFYNKYINLYSNNNLYNNKIKICSSSKNFNIKTKNIIHNKYIFDLFLNKKKYINENKSFYDIRSINTSQNDYSLNNQGKNNSVQIKYEKTCNDKLSLFKEAKHKNRIRKNLKKQIHPQILYFRNNAINLIKTANSINNNIMDSNTNPYNDNDNIMIINRGQKNNFYMSPLCFLKKKSYFSEKKKNVNQRIFLDNANKNKIKNKNLLNKYYTNNNLTNKNKCSYIIENSRRVNEKNHYTYYTFSKGKMNRAIE